MKEKDSKNGKERYSFSIPLCKFLPEGNFYINDGILFTLEEHLKAISLWNNIPVFFDGKVVGLVISALFDRSCIMVRLCLETRKIQQDAPLMLEYLLKNLAFDIFVKYIVTKEVKSGVMESRLCGITKNFPYHTIAHNIQPKGLEILFYGKNGPYKSKNHFEVVCGYTSGEYDVRLGDFYTSISESLV